jgi:hypothetical protein
MQITLFASPSISFRQMRDGPPLLSIPGFDAYLVQTKRIEGDQSKVVFVLPIFKEWSVAVESLMNFLCTYEETTVSVSHT